ncbi:hypothetical protein CAOG_08919 [Capsaspora owczarzaki ATCC 30864]|uniref:TOG domain-containing protein n=1 Tax=Capsaspora owczarzaki (strain ATCC 30864) TaxID=595528 RepID=A0A0D2WU49_CAPO3|nr:hypothetical protein CAOG_08919 [Capsaspora owczarzaki ATCC 30864]KJE95363.1 hypothetical protein CAOG_008919 [Capsaspora owczarzaki ATCC 30864]|eukprot:XP_011270590.1 hypothetical protein CAOG_08919 [Capsaspora owczarzaki ATCC 30864]
MSSTPGSADTDPTDGDEPLSLALQLARLSVVDRARCELSTSSTKARIALLRSIVLPAASASATSDAAAAAAAAPADVASTSDSAAAAPAAAAAALDDDDVRALVQELFDTAFRYADRESRRAVEDVLAALITTHPDAALPAIITALAAAAKRSVTAVLSTSQPAFLVYLSWACAVLKHAFPVLNTSAQTAKLDSLLESLAQLLESCLVTPRVSVQRSAAARVSALFRRSSARRASPAHHDLVKVVLERLLALTPTAPALLLLSQTIAYITRVASRVPKPATTGDATATASPVPANVAACQALLDAHKKAAIEFLLKTTVTTKTRPAGHVVQFSLAIVRLVSHDEFASSMLTAIDKAVLRNPEVVLNAIAGILGAVRIDLSKYAAQLAKSLCTQLKANDESVRADACLLFRNLARQSSDPAAVDSILANLFDVLNGVHGKLTAFEHRASVLEAIALVHDAQLVAAAKHTVAVTTIEKLAAALAKETHDGTIAQILDTIAIWAAHLSSFPASVSTLFSEGIKSAKPAIARGYLNALAAATKASPTVAAAAAGIFTDALLGVVRAAKTQTQLQLSSNAVVAATVLLYLLGADVSIEAKLGADKFWETLFDAKSKLILTDKLIAATPDKDLAAEVDLAAQLLRAHEARLNEADATALSLAVVQLLGASSWSVRKHARELFSAVLSFVNAKATLTRLLDALRVSAFKFAGLPTVFSNALFTVTALSATASGADKEAAALGSLMLAHHPTLPVVSAAHPSVWISILTRNKVDAAEFVVPRVERLLDLVQGPEGLGNADAATQQAASRALASLIRISPNPVLSALIRRITSGADSALVAGVGEEDVAIWKTPEGTLHNRDLIKEATENAASTSGLSKTAAWDAKVKAEIAAKKAAASGQAGAPKVELSKKQQEMVAKQLQAESETRAKVNCVSTSVSTALTLARTMIHTCSPRTTSGLLPVLEVHEHLPAIVSTLLPLFSSPLVSEEAVTTFLTLEEPLHVQAQLPLPAHAHADATAHVAGRLSRVARSLLYATLRSIQPRVYAPLPQAWTQEPLAHLVARVVGRISVFVDARLLPAGEFAICLPLLRSVLLDPKATLQLAHQAFRAAALHVDLGNQRELPRLDLIKLLLVVIVRHNRLEKEASGALVKLAQSMGDSATPVEVQALLDAVLSASPTVRESSLEALAHVPINKDSAPALVLIWLAQSDSEEKNMGFAKHLWDSRHLQLQPAHCDLFVDSVLSSEEHVRVAAARAIANAVGLFVGSGSENAVPRITSRLIALYAELLRAPEPERDMLGNLVNREWQEPWWSRSGIALALAAMSPHFGDAQVLEFFQFLVNGDALGDSSEDVRQRMLDAGQTALDAHGKQHIRHILPVFEQYLDSAAPPSEKHDRIRESVVVLLGSLARHLDASDPKIPPIFAKLVSALETPSQQVQEAVSKCLPPLVPAIAGDIQSYVQSMLHSLLEGERYAIRRGAAYGLGGIVKGKGIGALKDFNIMPTLQDAIQDKKVPRHREGALLAFEILCNTLGRLFEPYIIHILPHLLVCFGDGNKDVRAATQDTSKAIMTNLSAYGVKLVLPSLLNALEDNAWRTKQGSVELLGAMSYCAPKQLSSCLPMIVPKLTEVLTDSHAKVQEAGEDALRLIGSVIRNPEIQGMVQKLLDALRDPNAKTQAALSTLLETAFVHFIDAPSLALIMPILQRALRERATETKKMAAQIIGNMSSLADHKDLLPYLSSLLPGLKQVLLDPIPEVRGIAARALGTLVKGIGEDKFAELLPWLLDTIRSETSAVDRAGAAQGLSEVLAALGVERLEALIPDILQNATSGKTVVREGYLMLFVFLPGTFGESFKPFINTVLPPVLKGLADESEAVRDAALRGGQMIINYFAQTSVTLLLPELERGLFDDNWRIRQCSVQLLGDLLYRISGLSGKKTTVSDEDDTFGTEDARLAILASLGEERRNRVLAGLYMARSDVALIVRQASLHVWKTIVTNTPRTLREVLTTLMTLLLGFLASKSYDQRTVAARTLGDLVRKLGDRVLPEIIPMIEQGLESEDSARRQGVCVGLSEIMSTTSKDHILVYVGQLIPAVRKALCDPLPEVRESAAQTFDHLFRVVGNSTIDDIVPALLESLQDPNVAPFALDGLRQIMAVKSHVVLPFLVPKLLVLPITASHARALAALTSVAGSALNKHLSAILPALLDAICSGASSDSMHDIEDAAKALVLGVDNEAGMRLLVADLLDALKHPQQASRRLAAANLLLALCDESEFDWSPHLTPIMDALLRRFVDADDRVVLAAWNALAAATKSIDKDEMTQHIPNVRRTIKHMTENGVGGPVSQVKGFAVQKGIGSILPMFLHGLIYGSPETKEQAAAGLGDLIRLTDPAALKPYVIQITGPLIRVVGDKFSWQVKAAILDTLTLLIARVGIMLKPFLPQLQTTFIKALHDPTKVVRVRASNALTQLISLHTRVDPLLIELHTNVKAVSGTVQESMLRALFGAISQAGASMGEPVKKTLLDTMFPLLGDNDDSVRFAAAQVIGAVSKFLNDDEFEAYSRPLLQDNASADDDWLRRHGLAVTLSAILREGAERVFGLGHGDAAISESIRQLHDDKVPISTAAVHSIAAILQHFAAINQSVVPAGLIEALGLALKQGSSDVKLVAIRAVKVLAKTPSTRGSVANQVKILVPPMVDAVREKNTAVRLAAESALIYLIDAKNGEEKMMSVAKLLSTDHSRALIDYTRRVLIPRAQGSAESDDDDSLKPFSDEITSNE